MRSSLVLSVGFLAASLSGAPALAKPLSYALPEDTTAFRPGPGSDAAQNNCMACHSVDYVATQPPKKGKEFWAAEVTKMIKVYGASIPEQDAAAIADYLASTY
jgi:mono/diheme cytochrome c family protein